MKVANIKTDNLSLDKTNKYYKMLENRGINIEFNSKNVLSFDLLDSNEAFANGIRRVFNDELETFQMDVKPQDITTDDKFILPDLIRERLNLIPFAQSFSTPIEQIKFQIHMENEDEDIIKIYSKDIKMKIGNKILEVDNKLFNNNVQICSLRPKCHLYLNNIHLSKRYGYNNNAHTIGTVRYQCLNVDFSKSCLEQNLTDFRMELCDNSQSSCKEMVELIYNNLFFRLTKFKKLVMDYEIPPDSESNVDQSLNANLELYIINNTKIIDLKAEGDINKKNVDNLYEIHVNNEYHTVGNIVAKYVFMIDNNIELINYKLVHILKHKIVITIKHPDYKKIISKAVDNFISDLSLWKKTLLSNI